MAAAIGVSTRTLGYYENDDRAPDANTIKNICAETGCNAHWLIYGTGPMMAADESGIDVSGQSVDAVANAKDFNQIIDGLRAENESLKTELAGLQWKTSVPVLGLAECGITGWQVKRSSSLKTQPPPDMTDPTGTFAVIAFGDSMAPLGINDGFLLYCNEVEEPEQFDIVYVELEDNRATVKQFVGFSEKAGGESYMLQGYLPSKNNLPQEPFTIDIIKSKVVRVAVVRYIKRGL